MHVDKKYFVYNNLTLIVVLDVGDEALHGDLLLHLDPLGVLDSAEDAVQLRHDRGDGGLHLAHPLRQLVEP